MGQDGWVSHGGREENMPICVTVTEPLPRLLVGRRQAAPTNLFWASTPFIMAMPRACAVGFASTASVARPLPKPSIMVDKLTAVMGISVTDLYSIDKNRESEPSFGKPNTRTVHFARPKRGCKIVLGRRARKECDLKLRRSKRHPEKRNSYEGSWPVQRQGTSLKAVIKMITKDKKRVPLPIFAFRSRGIVLFFFHRNSERSPAPQF
ncbi:hypothetical protein DL96DRAFT_1565665 [Flagelloscypha sp. PMI_526]|nr:hypothetical protein DL96DRAFT_1565665 [Flagelloscypha sp. PMI_526]